MTACTRYQFRLPKDDERRIEDLAEEAGIPPNQIAKRIVQAALKRDPIDPEKIADDLLVIRAGVEQLFRRADRVEELDKAVRKVKTRRNGDHGSHHEGAAS